MITVRRFEPSDFEQVLEIESEVFSEHNPFLYMNFYEMNNEGFLVAEYSGSIVGFIVGYELNRNEGRIFSFAVREGFRSMGIGSRLMDAILAVFMTKLLQFASLEVRITNFRAQSFYKRIHFIACWVQRGYYSDGEDGIIMKKRLTPFDATIIEETDEPVLPLKRHLSRLHDYI